MSFGILIEEGKIREFAQASGATSPEHQGSAAVIPPTFLTTARLSWSPPGENPSQELDFDQARVLHGEEEYVFFGPPPRAGDALTVTSRIAERYEKQGRRGGVLRFAVLLTEFRDASMRLVAEQRTTLVETAVAPAAQ